VTFKIGLCGSHRTGKTTLAKTLANNLNLPFLATNTTQVFQQHGLNPADPLDFKTRLQIQHHILDKAYELWQTTNKAFITDRTPLDFMAYTLADIQGNTPIDFAELETYLTRCFTTTNQIFNQLIVLQPAIPLVYEPGKAALNRSYMEHLNLLIKGLSHDEQLHCPVLIINRSLVKLDARVQKILESLGHVIN
jgi:hypothetical protein